MILDLFAGRALTFNSAELVSRFGLCVTQIRKIKIEENVAFTAFGLAFYYVCKNYKSGDFFQINFGSKSDRLKK